MKVIQINNVLNGSTGKIARGIQNVLETMGMEAIIYVPKSGTNTKFCTRNNRMFGTIIERSISRSIDSFWGLHGCLNVFSTMRLIQRLNKEIPDVIHLHNLHNSYINLSLLFTYIKKRNIPVVWTLHDCWAFSGQCPHFTKVKCGKWKTGCHHCPQYRQYPTSCVDQTKTMWKLKKKWFTGVKNMTIVTPSYWLADLVKESFLSEYPVKVINNGIDLSVFKFMESDFRKVYGLKGKNLVLGVAFGWGESKGYGDVLALADQLDDTDKLVLVGLSKEQIATLPDNILGIERTNSEKELAAIYSAADVFINTTYEDNYPTVNLEARACGLPVITYRTGGSPESAGSDAVIVEVGDIYGLKNAIDVTILNKRKSIFKVSELSSEAKFQEYVDLYRSAEGVFAHQRK